MVHSSLRDWSLIMRREGYKTGRGAYEVDPCEKGGGRVLAMLKGGGGYNKFWGNFYVVA